MRRGRKINPSRHSNAKVDVFASPEKMALPVADEVWACDRAESIASAITGNASLERRRKLIIKIVA